jgi:hypothetical protein
VVWPGIDVDGTPVPQGAWRPVRRGRSQHGPHSVVSAPITIGSEAFTVSLGSMPNSST